MVDNDRTKVQITPATTPGSLEDNEQRSLVISSNASRPPSPSSKISWYSRYPPPYTIMVVSLLQLIVFLISTKEIHKLLRYDPNNQTEVWRFVSYMFLHNNIFHIILNIIIQCLFAVMLEKYQGSLRVGVLYFGGGVAGALGASCMRLDLVEGASAGVYALLTSHLSHIILNFESTKYKLWGFICVAIIVLSDVTYNLVHYRTKGDPLISEGAHIAGAISGLLLGVLLYKSRDKRAETRNRIAFWISFVLFLVLIFILVFMNVKMTRCTSSDIQKVQYYYLC